jgi:hypothetical protein
MIRSFMNYLFFLVDRKISTILAGAKESLGSDAMMLRKLIIDTVHYKLNQDTRVFGIPV